MPVHRVPRTLLFSIVVLMSLALVGNPLAGSAQAAPMSPQAQQNGGKARVASSTDVERELASEGF
jgi:hypothetical protein